MLIFHVETADFSFVFLSSLANKNSILVQFDSSFEESPKDSEVLKTGQKGKHIYTLNFC